jgi:hypothetical protein
MECIDVATVADESNGEIERSFWVPAKRNPTAQVLIDVDAL